MAFVHDKWLDLPGKPHPTEAMAGRDAAAVAYTPKCVDPFPRHARGVVCELLGAGLDVPRDTHCTLATSSIRTRIFVKATRPLLNAFRSRHLDAVMRVGQKRGVLPQSPPYTARDIYAWGTEACKPDFNTELKQEIHAKKRSHLPNEIVDGGVNDPAFKRIKRIHDLMFEAYTEEVSAVRKRHEPKIAPAEQELVNVTAATKKELEDFEAEWAPVLAACPLHEAG